MRKFTTSFLFIFILFLFSSVLYAQKEGSKKSLTNLRIAEKKITPIYLNTRYSFRERAADLVASMTLSEEISQLHTNKVPSIPRLGVQEYYYWSEGQHGIYAMFGNLQNGGQPSNADIGVYGDTHSTCFPVNLAMAMSWDPGLIYREAEAISDEARGIVDKSLFGKSQNNLGELTAIRVKHPNIQLISTIDKSGLSKETPPDIVDEHYYLSASEMQKNANRFDSYDRKGPKIFVGEWASMEGRPTNNFNAALGDAAWMTGMERNADIVTMSAYAPLFSNVNKGATQWTPDLIGYNVLSVYGSPCYYAQKMFNTYLGNELVSVAGENIPTQMQKLNRRDSLDAIKPKMLPTLFYVATKNSKTGTVYLKVVNTSEKMQTVNIDFKGKIKVMQNGLSVTLKSDDPMNTNSITDPEKIVPVNETVKKIKKNFNYTVPAYSISVLQVETKE